MMSKLIVMLFFTLLLVSLLSGPARPDCGVIDPTELTKWEILYVGMDGEFDLFLFINPDHSHPVKTVLGAVLRVGDGKGLLATYGYRSGEEVCLYKNTNSSFIRIPVEGKAKNPFGE